MKKRLLFLLPLLLLACRALTPVSVTPPTPTINQIEPTATEVSSMAVLEATAFAPTPDFTLTRIHPKDGDLQSQLAAQVKKAEALGQTPFVEFDATWCPPCQAITASLVKKDPLMMSAYKGVYLIHVDIDEWAWDGTNKDFAFKGIPAFFALDSTGNATGAMVTGAAWQEDIPENIAPVLTEFFHP